MRRKETLKKMANNNHNAVSDDEDDRVDNETKEKQRKELIAFAAQVCNGLTSCVRHRIC